MTSGVPCGKPPSPSFPVSSGGEATTVRTWFNSNRRKIFSEVSLQCCLPYKKTNFQMDREEAEAEEEEDIVDLEDVEHGGDVLRYV